MCDGYHLFWMTLSKANSSTRDMMVSINVSKALNERAGQNKEFGDYSLQTFKAINVAVASGNSVLVKQFAGVCHELGYPVGQNTGR